jgi:hypothetical protein
MFADWIAVVLVLPLVIVTLTTVEGVLPSKTEFALAPHVGEFAFWTQTA